MRVLLPKGTKLEGFERELQSTLEKADLAGYAFMGFTFREIRSSRLHEIDALVVMEPGVFVCLEAKGYRGTWTGNPNGVWFCNDQKIRAVNTNPYRQVRRYSHVIRDRLRHETFKGINLWVNHFVVAPDGTNFKIKDAVINQFQHGNVASVCHLSRIEQVLGSIRASEAVANRVNEVGLISIINELVGHELIDPLTRQPKATPRPEATPQPKATPRPEATPQPKATPQPVSTPQPKTTPQPYAAP